MPEFVVPKLLTQAIWAEKRREHGLSLADFHGKFTKLAMDKATSQYDTNYEECQHAITVSSADYLLTKLGRPYFKIYPEFVEALVATKLNVPGKYCQLPYEAFEIRFARGFALAGTQPKHLTCPGEALEISSLLVCREFASALVTADVVCKYCDVYGNSTDKVNAKHLREFTLEQAEESSLSGVEQLTVIMRLVGSEQYPLMCSFGLDLAGTLEESVIGDGKTEGLLDISSDATRLIAAVIFLATNHDQLIEPDVLSKDLAKFCQPGIDEAVIEKLHTRATKRRGEGRGYTIGRRDRLLHVAQIRNAELGEEGRELNHQHQRRGHIHRYHAKDDEGNKEIRFKWIPQLTVRPDLPVDTKGQGGIVIK